VLEFANLAAFPATGTIGIIYVALDTGKIYRWSGSAYVEISPSPGSTDSVPEGSVNKYYTDERVDDRAAALIVNGTGITWSYNDTAGTLTPTVSVAYADVTGKPSTFPPSAHNHPQSDITNLVTDLALKAPLASPAMTGTPTVPTATAGTNTTQAASTAFVAAAVVAAGGASPSNANPVMDGTAAPGSSALYSRGDHVHPSDTSLVAKSGSTMTGDLIISKVTPAIQLNKTAGGGGYNSIEGYTGGSLRWRMLIGSIAAESGSNAGSDFYLINHNDAGTEVGGGYPLSFNRATGLGVIKGDPTAALGIATKQYTDTKVAKAGDVMTGDLTIQKNTPVLFLDKTASGQPAAIGGRLGGISRWSLHLADAAAETGANVGSDFRLFSFNDAGSPIGQPFVINRATGIAAFQFSPTAPTPAVADRTTKLATTAFVNQDQVVGTTVDFNTLTAPGTYVCSTTSANPNEPTGAGQWYVRVATYGGAPTYVVQMAHSLLTEGLVYTRICLAGTWKPWVQLASTAYAVARAGDTMSGALVVTPKGSTFGSPAGTVATGAVTPADANIMLYNFNANNWSGFGSDASGNMWARVGTVGTPVPAFWLNASNNRAMVAGDPVDPLGVATKQYSVARAGDTMTGTLSISCASARLYISDTGSGGAGSIFTQVRGVTQWQINCCGDYDGGPITIFRYDPAGTFIGTPVLRLDRTTGNAVFGGSVDAAGLFVGRPGVGAAPGYPFSLNWVPSVLQAWVQSSNVGNVTLTSDYRAKENVLDLPSMWDVVRALRPIEYNFNDWTPPWEAEAQAKRAAERGVEAEPFMARDPRKRWGFIAHELQETTLETAATGFKDAQNIIQSPDPMTILAALTKVVQELQTRIEALEARLPV
jgi:Chaperone of endosialidase